MWVNGEVRRTSRTFRSGNPAWACTESHQEIGRSWSRQGCRSEVLCAVVQRLRRTGRFQWSLVR